MYSNGLVDGWSLMHYLLAFDRRDVKNVIIGLLLEISTPIFMFDKFICTHWSHESILICTKRDLQQYSQSARRDKN
jgi:hypothetical protein